MKRAATTRLAQRKMDSCTARKKETILKDTAAALLLRRCWQLREWVLVSRLTHIDNCTWWLSLALQAKPYANEFNQNLLVLGLRFG